MIKQEPSWDPPNIKPEPIEHPPDHPPTKRQKTQTSDPQTTSLKGKSKLVKDEEQEVDNCGICLLEQGVSIRGYINSCDHYFCFVCIMEWAKVESRCPICKRRFSSIKRPTKEGVFVEERVVNVPVRDQVHYFNGNATVGPPNLYTQIKCSFCNLSTDDSVLLLCDLCDSAAHTYCVGLGQTVPEEDWFCKDCTLSRDEHAKVETATTSDMNDNNNDNNPSSSNTIRFAPSDVSIHDIIGETITRHPQTPSVPDSVPTSVNQSESRAEQSNTQSPFFRTTNVPNARTLQRCRNVHSRIRVLRENWNSFRGGSLNFSSTFGNGNKARRGQEQSSSGNQESMSEKSPYNTDKAWKMMDMAAKALGRRCGNKSSFGKDSKFPIKNERLANEASKVSQAKNKILDKNKPAQGTVKNNINHVEHGLPSSRKISAPAEIISGYNRQNLARNECLVGASNVVGTSDQSSHLIRSLSIATDKRCAEKEINATVEKGAPRLDKNIKEVENAKSEIQSLVKLNLKILSKDNKFDVDVFKEVARHATHSIMAACDIEPPKARFRSFERLVCHHNETQKWPSSSLMPTACRECFFVFVKDVVTTIAFDRTGSCKA